MAYPDVKPPKNDLHASKEGKDNHRPLDLTKQRQLERQKLAVQVDITARKEQAEAFKDDQKSILALLKELKDHGVAAISRQEYSADSRYTDYKSDQNQVAQSDDRTQLRIHTITHQILDGFRQAGKYHISRH